MTTRFPHKPQFLKVTPPRQKSLVIKGDVIAWHNPWHFHPEVELIYCIKGRGTNFVGNYITAIEEGELLLMGKNLPHTRQRDRKYYEEFPEEQPESIVVQFQEDFLGGSFFDIDEFSHIRRMLEQATRGIRFLDPVRRKIIRHLERMPGADPTTSVIEFLHVLNIMARTDHFDYLNPESFHTETAFEESVRINMVYRYSVEHFHDPVQLADVAALINMSVPSFCRFFKSRTRKTYYQYLIELRVGYACKMLLEGNVTVSEVCFACGFNNLSNFHKQFKSTMGVSPGQYREKGKKRIPGTPNPKFYGHIKS